MNQVELNIIIEKLKQISSNLYLGDCDTIEESLKLDKVISELEKSKQYLPSGL